jgi:two-component system, NarL family, sensor kinase
VRAPNGDGLETELEAESGIQLDPEREELVYRTAQEAMRNVHRHARATTARVSLSRVNGTAVLTVVDNGAGFDAATAARRRDENHFGLELLTDRAERLGGSLQMISSPGEGTTVRLEVPVT